MLKSLVWNIPQWQNWWKGYLLGVSHSAWDKVIDSYILHILFIYLLILEYKVCKRLHSVSHSRFIPTFLKRDVNLSLSDSFLLMQDTHEYLSCLVHVYVHTAHVCLCMFVGVCVCVSALYRHGWDDLFHFICQLLLLGVFILLQCLDDLKHTHTHKEIHVWARSVEPAGYIFLVHYGNHMHIEYKTHEYGIYNRSTTPRAFALENTLIVELFFLILFA